MIFGYLTLATALIISLSSAVYSILGLTAIFAAAFWPIVILGGSLEIGKIVTTLWLHKYWNKAELQYKVYLCAAVAVLMFLTSMGVFGFLSKAHSDQALVSGDVTSKLEIYDEKIKTAKENIESDRKQLKQMDEAVDQVMARSTTEGGADKSNAIRKSQAKDRASLAKDIEANQKIISQLNDQAAPIRAEVRKVEADVGPIKYIAALIYGDNPDANLLEHAVRWVIILIVSVFDPLALTLLLAATKTFEWERGIDLFNLKKPEEEFTEEEIEELNDLNPTEYEVDDGPFTQEQFEQLTKELAEDILNKGVTNTNSSDNIPIEEYNDFFNGAKSLQEVEQPVAKLEPDPLPKLAIDPTPIGWMFGGPAKKEEVAVAPVAEDEFTKWAKDVWIANNPDQNADDHHAAHAAGEIDMLPWHHPEHIENLPISDGERKKLQSQVNLMADNVPKSIDTVTGFGTSFPVNPKRGDGFLRVDQLPTVLYKYNGQQWIKVDKGLTDNYVYDDAYINHLIEKIGSGEYDPDLLSDAERERIATKLNN